MKIIIDENCNLNQGNGGLITGEIYFEEDNNYFPEKGWNDFPIIILGWWINSFIKFVKQNSNTFEFCFMDGPFKLVGLVIHNEIQNMLLKACRKLFRIVELSNISTEKLDGLKKLFTELKELQL